jgi:L-threonylcarbamoyladenylate synthase
LAGIIRQRSDDNLIPRDPNLRTQIIETSAASPQPEALDRAADVIRRGKVVALPTDALYVLAADPFQLQAVAGVFRAKGRDAHRSLPILVDSLQMAEDYSVNLTSRFYLLARRFWPGPLTIIVPASSLLPLRVTGNTGRLAVRQSSSEVVRGIVARLQSPIIATSANVSGQPTCRTGIEVLGEMDGRVDLVLDGGLLAAQGATTVDITEPEWKLIREGAISKTAIDDCLHA